MTAAAKDVATGTTKKVLILAATCEVATGLALLIVPSFVVQLLLGAEPTKVAVPIARVAGIALIALGIACWPGSPLAGMLIYGALVALYLAYLGFLGAFNRRSTLAGSCPAPDPDNASDLGGVHETQRSRMTMRCLLLAQSGHGRFAI
jgi:hypothetical protein